MPDLGGPQARHDEFGGDRHADLAYVRAQCALLGEACTRTHQTAAMALQTGARILADCRRSRGELVRARLPRDASCGATARRLVEGHLAAASADELSDVKTVVSELVNNAFLHGDGAIELRVSSRRGRARIEVIDEGEGAGVRASHQDEYHGLDIVDALALAWGTRAGSTCVWAELPLRGRRSIGRSARLGQIGEALDLIILIASRVALDPGRGRALGVGGGPTWSCCGQPRARRSTSGGRS